MENLITDYLTTPAEDVIPNEYRTGGYCIPISYEIKMQAATIVDDMVLGRDDSGDVTIDDVFVSFTQGMNHIVIYAAKQLLQYRLQDERYSDYQSKFRKK